MLIFSQFKGGLQMAIKEAEVKQEVVSKMIDGLVSNAEKALKQFNEYDQKQIDEIIKNMAIAGLDQHMPLAKLAVEETKRGVYEDKIIKNLFATEYIWNSIKDERTV